jgi:hypothetical protein
MVINKQKQPTIVPRYRNPMSQDRMYNGVKNKNNYYLREQIHPESI